VEHDARRASVRGRFSSMKIALKRRV
jgi:hypothetical protein